MNEDTAILLFMFAVSATSAVGLGVAWIRTSMRLRKLEDRLLEGGSRSDDTAERLERVVESLAAQVDQLTSSQDFMNRVLTERLDKLGKALPAPEPESTPR